jgi:hypothetical protein
VGLLSGIFRRTKAEESKPSAVFALATARADLEARHQMKPTGKAGLCFRPQDSPFFKDLEQEVRGILSLGEDASATRYQVADDSLGFRWIILQDQRFDELVSAVHMVAQTFADHNLQGQLLAAVFPFQHQGQEVQWILNYKRGAFYPFVPLPGAERRDNQLELDLSAKVKGLLPLETDLERWYGLWGAPFSAL